MTNTVSQNTYVIASGSASTSPFVEIFLPRNPTPQDINNYQVQQRWWNTVANTEWVLVGFTSTGGVVQANWQEVSTGSSPTESLTGDDNQVVLPVLNNINVKGAYQPGAAGAIRFTKDGSVAGQLDATVQVDNTTIIINASNELSVNPGQFISAVGVDTYTPPGTNPAVPTSDNEIFLNGVVVDAGSSGVAIRTDCTGLGEIEIQLQKSGSSSATSPNLNGVCHFNTANFTVDANGFVSFMGGSGTPTKITTEDSNQLTPISNNINLYGTGSITTTGNVGTATATVTLTGLTNHAVLVGSGTPTIVNVSPATAGIPLVSNGASSDPSFSTAEVVGGGTGATSLTPYSVICGGTAATTPVQQVSGLGSSGQVLTSNGPGALPTWQTSSGGSGFNRINQILVSYSMSPYSYVPSSGAAYIDVQVVGGGGGSGGSTGNGTFDSSGGGGGGGGYSQSTLSPSSQTVTIGAGGTAGAIAGNGGAGGTSSFGSVLQATGGGGGFAGGAGGTFSNPGAGGIGSGGLVNTVGTPGDWGIVTGALGGPGGHFGVGGNGGSSFFGGGAYTNAVQANGFPGTSYGGGASGGQSIAGGGSQAGGAGFPGVVIITEYIA